MAISKKTWLGLAVESSPGTAVTVPVRYVPCKSTFKGIQKPEYTEEDRNSRDKNFTAVYGPRSAEFTIKGDWYNDASVPFLFGAMGASADSQPNSVNCPTVYKHALTMADVCPVFTLAKYYQTQAYYFSYSAVSKWGLKFSGESKNIENDVTLMGRFPQVLASPPSPVFTAIPPFAGYAPTITLGSLGTTSDILDVDIEFTQKLDPWTPPAGSPDFVTLYFGEREATVSFTARFDVSTLYQNYWMTPTQDSFSFDVKGALIASYSGTNYNQEFYLDFPTINYDSMEVDEGKVNLLVKAKATAIASPTLATQLMSAWITNTVASYAAG